MYRVVKINNFTEEKIGSLKMWFFKSQMLSQNRWLR